jgi:DNA (cytosine-5)-methyltransferase 1
MKYGSLFSGIGGFDIALNRAGFIPAWMCEIDKSCQNILKRHFEGVKIYDDVTTIRNAEPVDLICGGFPCQDLSVAGKRAGLAGERSGLWFEFARVIDELEPKWVVIENVPGLLSSSRGADFAVIIQWLAQRGYGVSWRILDAQYFGVPQRRRRVFIVGSLGNGRSAEVLFERESGIGDTAPSREKRKKIANDAPTSTLRGFGHGWQGQHNDTNAVMVQLNGDRDNPGVSIYDNVSPTVPANPMSDRRAAVMVQRTVGALQERDYKGVGSQYVNENKCVVANTLAGGSSKCHSDITSGQQDSNLVLATSRTLRGGKDGGGKGYLGSEEMGMTLGGQEQYLWEMQHASEAYRESGDVVPTLQQRVGTGGNNVPLVGVRRLTPTECERLQGFPDGWTEGQSDSTRYRQLGNAIAVPVVEWIAKRIIRHGA